MMADYKPVPVEVARQIAQQFDKCIVVVMCFDEVHLLTHATTYGMSALDKAAAAFLGDEFTRTMGANLSEKKTFEDFRATPDDAKAAVQRETNERIARDRNELLGAAMTVVRDHFVGKNLHDSLDALQQVTRAVQRRDLEASANG
jgi:hypothetical protein